ncbi:winged helix-turn-helix domain-containing protein [Lysobacter capsici]|jgi:two-component system OmpR family response regulator/two-component system response regulator RstA|uniref:winged helix-turn-helix domain-containing protein n=1 Tax=Lysobacter capsici TaxID=435897 RepID=UPI00071658D7|nr:winged helix-turn-helix domain-containing protein [Lysobacter capsici]ALN86610.1 response regulator [Lysobacter capsici]ATE72558.1 DNA-binding response regulator [Lysobacter capsici]UOF13126.1 winged helix-turn-helix domain-containing protein [Lysobacter capsici]
MTDILLIEDDERLGALVAHYLGKHGYRVAVEADGARAVQAILERAPALVLLDISLPGQDGFEICRAVRARYAGIICMLTARTDDIDQVLGLELGADDYIGKPIEPRVLLARLRAHLRRDSAARQGGDLLCFGQLRIDRGTREATLHARRIELTTAEFDLLVLLADRAGHILSRDDLLQSLRGINFDGLDRSIDARISRLRRKLGDLAEEPERIKTVRGKGYLFNRAAWE